MPKDVVFLVLFRPMLDVRHDTACMVTQAVHSAHLCQAGCESGLGRGHGTLAAAGSEEASSTRQ